MATIKNHTAEAYEEGQIDHFSNDYQVANRQAIKLSSTFIPLIRVAIGLGFVATLIYGGILVVRGELNVGAYSTMIFMTQRLLWPLTRLGQTIDLCQRAMERIIIGRTTIVIAHRLSTVRNADQIFVLDKGILCEHGRHEELVTAGGIYAGLWLVQTGQQDGSS